MEVLLHLINTILSRQATVIERRIEERIIQSSIKGGHLKWGLIHPSIAEGEDKTEDPSRIQVILTAEKGWKVAQ